MLTTALLCVAGGAWDLKAVVQEHAQQKDEYSFSAAVEALNGGSSPPSLTKDVPLSSGNPRAALITAVVGQLPKHIGLLAQSCGYSAAAADCLIYYTDKGAHDASLLPLASSNVHFKYITKVDFITKLMKGISRNRKKHGKDFIFSIETDPFYNDLAETYDKTKNVSEMVELFRKAGGGKANDIKCTYGAMFEDELMSYSHWGWVDSDVILGNLTKFILPLLRRDYDAMTFENGEQNSVFFAGQLSIFKNDEHSRWFWGRSGHPTYGMSWSIAMAKNTGFDEHGTMQSYTLGSQRKLHVDFTLQTDSSRICGQVQSLILALSPPHFGLSSTSLRVGVRTFSSRVS
jgi:hypothetical protein